MISVTEVLAGLSLAGVIALLKQVIDFKKTADENKKVLLEIQKLRMEMAEADRRIVVATMEEVMKYNPRYGELMLRDEELTRSVTKNPRNGRIISGLFGLLFFFLAGTIFTAGLLSPIKKAEKQVAADFLLLQEFSNHLDAAELQFQQLSQANFTLSNSLSDAQHQLAKLFTTNTVEDRIAFASDTMHFEPNSTVISEGDICNLKVVASLLAYDPFARLVIEGNSDEEGSEEYNRTLGERRALAAREALARFGIDPSRVQTISYGKDRPVDPEHSESAAAKNRRVDFILLRPKGLQSF